MLNFSLCFSDAKIQVMFDTVCKFLAETFSADFASWLLGEPVSLSKLSPSELSLEPIRADALILLQSEETVLQLEFQSRPNPDMAFRMADYRLRVYRRFPHKTMRQVVIYLQRTRSEEVHRNSFEISGMRHEFEVIRLWEQSSVLFLQRPGLLPLAVLAQAESRPQLLEQVATQIDAISDARTQSNVAASTAILAGLVLDKRLIQQVLRKETMQESVIYQEIIAEGRRAGRQEGRQEGRRQEAIALIQRLLTRQLGVLPEGAQPQLSGLSLEQIESLGEALLDFDAATDLESWLTRQQVEVARIFQRLGAQLGELPAEVSDQVQALSLEQLALLETTLTKVSDVDELRVWLQEQTTEDENFDHLQ